MFVKFHNIYTGRKYAAMKFFSMVIVGYLGVSELLIGHFAYLNTRGGLEK